MEYNSDFSFKKYKIRVLTTVVMQIWKEKLVFFACCYKMYEITNKNIAVKLKNIVWYVWIKLGFATYCKYLWKFRSAGEYEKSISNGKFLSEAQNYYSFKITVKVSNSIDNNKNLRFWNLAWYESFYDKIFMKKRQNEMYIRFQNWLKNWWCL